MGRHVRAICHCLQDYEAKDYNIKQPGKAYWELGRLGADLESEELQEKVGGGNVSTPFTGPTLLSQHQPGIPGSSIRSGMVPALSRG